MTAPHPDVALADALGALASPTRLALLRRLRAPKALAEIDVRAPDEADGGRPLARQTVREHLDRLLEAGFVSARETERASRETTEFLVNHQTVYALAEEVRGLARLRPLVDLEAATSPGPSRGAAAVERPALVVVKGLDEGAAFPLATGGAAREWTLGRARSSDIAIDFDPYVSLDNARIGSVRGEYWIEDAESSRNGTSHNFRLLAKGERSALRHGDVVGVGRTLLVAWL